MLCENLYVFFIAQRHQICFFLYFQEKIKRNTKNVKNKIYKSNENRNHITCN